MLTLVVDDSVDRSFTSKAYVASSTFNALHASWSSYVALRYRSAAPAVFRLEISDEVDADSVRIDHWPGSQVHDHDASIADVPAIGAHVDARCVAPALIRTVQYMELVPAGRDQPTLALAFAKTLLRKRIFTGANGVITLQYDGIDYGRWRFQAYYRGKAAAATVRSADATENQKQGVEGKLDAVYAIVNEQTLVLMFPFASSQSSLDQDLLLGRSLQPMGAHGQSFRELVAMALQPSSASTTGRREAGESTARVHFSDVLHPSKH